jgi:hypothetical protein
VHWELCLCAASPARTSRGPAGGCRTLATNTDRPLTNPPPPAPCCVTPPALMSRCSLISSGSRSSRLRARTGTTSRA